MTKALYDDAFYDRTDRSKHAARMIVPVLRSFVDIHSVLDVGCARGAWLSAWLESGCRDFVGIDGADVVPAHLAIDPAHFVVADLSLPFNLGRRFDFAQCLEVAEHLPRARSETLVADLVSHSDVVLFSAAPPGQGGAYHINEQPYDYWKTLFGKYSYVAFDCLRPMIWHMREIPFWYRYNPILYVKSESVVKLIDNAIAYRLPPDGAIPDISPLIFRMRKAILRNLSTEIITYLSGVIAWRGRQ